MKKLDKVSALTKSYYRLFELTCNPVFLTANLYIKRTNNVVLLPPMKEDIKTDELSL